MFQKKKVNQKYLFIYFSFIQLKTNQLSRGGFTQIVNRMTSIIGVLFSNNLQSAKTRKQSSINTKKQSLQKPNRKSRFFSQHHNEFLCTGVHSKYDLLILSKASHQQISIQAFLITKLGEILKTSSEISRIELIQRCFDEQEFYRPCVNPITGFLYFKLDFFILRKEPSQFTRPSKAHQILKRIDIQKLFSSVQKIQGIEKQTDSDEFQGWRAQEQKLRLSSAKAISKTIQGSNLEIGVSNEKQKNINKQYIYSRPLNKFYQKFFESSKEKQTSIDDNRIIFSLKENQKIHPHLSTFVKKKSRRINFDPLSIDVDTKAKLQEHMREMCSNNIDTKTIKLNEEAFGNINIKLQRLSNNAFNTMLQFFGSLSKHHEYENLEKYFDPKINLPIKIILESKGQSLQRYLQKNSNSISIETKMRILVQIYTFVNVLWEENEMVFMVDDLKHVLITKKLGVKMKFIENFFKSQKQMIWEHKDALNEKRSECILNLSSLFFKLFYRFNLLYTRPKIQTSNSSLLVEECKLNGIKRMSISESIPKEITGKTKELLVSLNFIFSQQVYTSSKIIKKRQMKDVIERRRDVNNRIERRMDQNNKSKVNVDIGTDCSDEDMWEEGYELLEILDTRHIACWLMNNM